MASTITPTSCKASGTTHRILDLGISHVNFKRLLSSDFGLLEIPADMTLVFAADISTFQVSAQPDRPFYLGPCSLLAFLGTKY